MTKFSQTGRNAAGIDAGASGRGAVKKIILAEVDGLRGIAISAVVLHHLFARPLTALNLHWLGVPPNPLLGSGWLGVNLFFVLSGFVLCLPYASGQRSIRGFADWRRFYAHRALRLLSAYYLATFAMMALIARLPFGDWYIGLQTIGLLTFTFPLMPTAFQPSLDWAPWSIGTEVMFSAMFPAMCLLGRRFGAARLLIVCVPLSMAGRYVGHAFAPSHIIWISEGLLIGRLDEFVWGFLLAEFFCTGRLPPLPYRLLLAAICIFVPALVGFEKVNDGLWPFTADSVLVTLLDLGFALVVAAALGARSALSRGLTIRPLRVLGMGCYSLYFWHTPIIGALRLVIDPWNIPNLVGFGIMTVGLAGITYNFVEFRQVQDWRSLFLMRPAGVSVCA